MKREKEEFVFFLFFFVFFFLFLLFLYWPLVGRFSLFLDLKKMQNHSKKKPPTCNRPVFLLLSFFKFDKLSFETKEYKTSVTTFYKNKLP